MCKRQRLTLIELELETYNQLQTQLLGQQQYLSGLEGKYNAFLNRDDTKPCRDNIPTFIELK